MPHASTKAPPTVTQDRPIPIRGARRDRRTKRVVFGLTGLLGAAWALVIASRFSGILPN